MKKIFLKATAILLTAAFAIPFTACIKKPPADVDENYPWMPGNVEKNGYTDVSDLPSWDQKNMDLIIWNANQEGGFPKYNTSNNIVNPELKRITGINIDMAKSFDNSGKAVGAMATQLVMSGEKVHAAFTSETDQIFENFDVYDLTEYIEKYCPTIKRRMPKEVWDMRLVNGGQSGKVFGVPFGLGGVSLTSVDPLADAKTCMPLEFYNDYYGRIYVREDILTEAYPQALTNERLDEIYAANGKFTEDELFDIEITSLDAFYKFLEKIYQAIEAGGDKYALPQGRRVQTILAADGSDRDNWSLMGTLFSRLMGASGYLNTMFSYWDAEDQKVKMMCGQPFFKDMLDKWALMVAEKRLTNDRGTTAKYADIQSELNQGYYAVTYENAIASGHIAYQPDKEKNFNERREVPYRKLYLKIERDPRFKFFAEMVPKPQSFVIFKKHVPEGDIPQILQWLDLQQSELGDKLFGWGPRSAGLWELNADGVRQFKGPEKDALVADVVENRVSLGETVKKYNLSSGALESPQWTFPFFYGGGSKDHPVNFYSSRANRDIFYTSAAVVPHEIVPVAKRACMWTWTDGDLDGIQKIWSRRATVESALRAVLVSRVNPSGGAPRGQAYFENAYQSFTNQLQTVGWTDQYFGGVYTQKFLEINKDYLDGFYKG